MPITVDHSAVRRLETAPTIGLLSGFQMFSTEMAYHYIGSIMRGVRAAAARRHCNVLLSGGINLIDPPERRPAWPAVVAGADFLPVGPWNTDGLIFVHPLASPEQTIYLRQLKEAGFPVVCIGSTEGGPAIDVDNEGGIWQAMKHLAEHGHRHVAFIRGLPEDDPGDSADRYRAYLNAAQAFGMEINPRLVEFGYYNIGKSRSAMQKIISSGAHFTAVLASTDESAYAAADALMQAGLRVPQDVALIGFDDFAESTLRTPPLTTVSHPIFERGFRAAEILLDAIQNGRVPQETIVKLPTQLVIRRSCGCQTQDIIKPALADATNEVAVARERLKMHIAHAIWRSVSIESHRMNDAEIRQLAVRLVEAFVTSLDQGNATPFICMLQAILCRVEQTRGNAHPWGTAIEKLAQPDELRALIQPPMAVADIPLWVQAMMDEARTAVVESARRQRWRSLYVDNAEHALLTARLSAAFDEKQILKVLAERAPAFGVRQLAIGFFESEGNDPVAWTQLRTLHDPDAAPLRLRSREHSPFDFLPPGDATQLVLTPLLVHQHIRGYIVFDADNADLCAPLTYIINAALTAVYAHHEMIRLAHPAEPGARFGTHAPLASEEKFIATAPNLKIGGVRRDGATLIRSGKSKVILIADPDSGLLDVHTQLVHQKSKHYHVLQARDGKEAWTKIQEHLPDLVLLDLMLPQVDGFAILDAMHQFETTRRIPAIVTTCQPLGLDGMARLNRGVAAVLVKGVFTPQETLACIIHTLSSDKPLNGEAQHLTRKAMGYIHDHYIRPIKRQDIARHVGVSDHHLSRYFQHAAGVPPMTYVTRYRVQRAKQLLEADTLNIADVATAVGFTNEFYFSRVFRRETGVTPSRYRRGAVSR